MNNIIDTDKVEQILKDCAATYITPRFQSLTEGEIQSKTGPTDLVTIADIEAEEALNSILPDAYPGSIVIGEEGISSGTKSISTLQSHDDVIWVVDPVDGTFNFANGKPVFAIMLACIINGQTEYGWIYDIPGDRMMAAEKGSGVTISGDRKSFDQQSLELSELKGYAGRKYFPKVAQEVVDELREAADDISSLSCAGHEYLRLVNGEKDFSIYSKIRPWDHLAGALCIQEAGGVIRKWDNSTYTPQDDFGGLLGARSQKVWDSVFEFTIQPMTQKIMASMDANS